MTKLSVNVNKIATLRNARGENRPDLLKMAIWIEELGAHGITVHPRPDERHIKRDDVLLLKKHVRGEFNVEGYPSLDFINFMHEVRPHQVTLVPDPPEVLTSDAGFTLKHDGEFVAQAIARLKPCGARVSIFIDPKDYVDSDVQAIKDTGADRIELYTKAFADKPDCLATISRYQSVAERVFALGLCINAGHDLDLNNLSILLKAIPFIEEVSIGHALISDALIFGMPETMRRYLELIA